MRRKETIAAVLCAAMAAMAGPLAAQQRDRSVRPMAGPRATAIEITPLYVSPSTSATRIDKVQIGREMVVAERSGNWLRVYANTDIEEMYDDHDTPMVGADQAPPPISGWVQAKGIVEENTPNGDRIVMGAAANEEELASDPRGPLNAAQAARLLYRRVVEMFPHSPLAAEAAWRAADIHWQIQKQDNATLPSDRARDPSLRPQMYDDDLKKVIRSYPHTRWAALAAFDLIDEKLCGNWDGTPKCPEREAEAYEKYADDFPDGPRTPQALYDAVYRTAVLANLYKAAGDDGRAREAEQQAGKLAAQLRAKFPETDFSWRSGALVYKLEQGIPVYGVDLQ